MAPGWRLGDMMAPDRGGTSRLASGTHRRSGPGRAYRDHALISSQYLRRQGARDRPAQPQGLAIEPLDHVACRCKRPVDAVHQVTNEALVDRELAVGEQL